MAQFTRAERIRRRAEFKRAYDKGMRIRGRYATLFIIPNDLPVTRLGIAATKKLGSSVERNRAKRLIRETFRQNKLAPGRDIVVVPRRELLDAGQAAFEAEYRRNTQSRLRQKPG